MLQEIFSFPNDLESKLSLLAFQDNSLDVASEISRKYQGEERVELWKKLSERLFNETHFQAQDT